MELIKLLMKDEKNACRSLHEEEKEEKEEERGVGFRERRGSKWP